MNKQKIKKLSLAETHPEVAKQWHPTRNGDLTSYKVTAGSHKKVWWLCGDGHEYEACINNRVFQNSGCPYCSGRLTLPDKSIIKTHPELAQQWHPTKNGDLALAKVIASSKKSVWWQCSKVTNHEWQEKICNRTRRNNYDCKVCRSLACLKPALIEEWDPSNKISPYGISASSNKKVKWICKICGHKWLSSSANRFRGSGCPGCSGRSVTVSTSIDALYPGIAAEWDYSANRKTPKEFTAGSDAIVYWICSNGHQYKETIYNRTKRNRGCPVCKTFAYRCPNLVEEWSPENTLSPYQESAGSRKPVIWKCSGCGHSWKSKIVDRYYGHGCSNCNSGWTVDKIRLFVRSILPHIDSLTPAALYVLFQQTGLSNIDNSSRGRSFVDALKTGRFPKEELEKFVDEKPSLVDEFFANKESSLEENLESAENCLSELATSADENVLPLVETKDILASLHSKLISNADAETIDFFIKEAVARIWQHAFLNEQEAIKQIEQYQDDELYPREVKRLFLAEYHGAIELPIPVGYEFRYQPNLMQRYTAFLVKNRKRIGNWSGTGAGKTLSAILASRVVEAQLTIVCCPNNVIANWCRNIAEIFPDSLVFIKDLDLKGSPAYKAPQFLILNYEFFQQPESELRLKQLLDECCVNFIVIDEIHFSKQREPAAISKRRKVISAFLSEAATKNKDIHILGMSATPVINNLYEGKALIELVTGVVHDDLATRATVSNCVSLYKKFVSHGIRWVPQYDYKLNMTIEDIDCSEYLNEIKQHYCPGGYVSLEAILTKAKIPFILDNLKSKTIVYTHYLKGILGVLQEAIEQKGWKIAVFTGDSKDGLNDFVDGEADILIASSCIGAGIDRLQYVCNRLIINSLPWTHAEFEQLRGRIYRQGQKSKCVDILIPLTFADINGERWSWCQSRWKRIQFKKSIGDAAVDGIIPEGHLRSPGQAYKDVMQWLDRLERGDVNEIERSKISLTLTGNAKQVPLRKIGDITRMNQQINKETSQNTHKRFTTNPQEWHDYHAAYREARTDWDVVPYQEAIKWCKRRPHMVVADFGCGEAFLANELVNKVYSFDHIAINKRVTACDMAKVPLGNAVLDAAIFSLSLMGTNFVDYLKEAKRCLKLDGHLWIAEPTARFKDSAFFKGTLDATWF